MHTANRNTLISRRFSTSWVITVILTVFLSTIAGCASTNSGVVRGDEWTKGRVLRVDMEAINGEHVSPRAKELQPGAHTASVAVTWSNGWTDRTELQFEVQPEKWYWVLAYELKPGEQRECADIRMVTFGESLGMSAIEGAAMGTAPLWFPIAAVYSGMKKIFGHESPQNRPFDGCCFVWVQERESGAVIAGERP